MQIVLEIPDQLGAQLQQFGDRLPELLERGLQELLSDRHRFIRRIIRIDNFCGIEVCFSPFIAKPHHQYFDNCTPMCSNFKDEK